MDMNTHVHIHRWYRCLSGGLESDWLGGKQGAHMCLWLELRARFAWVVSRSLRLRKGWMAYSRSRPGGAEVGWQLFL